MAKQARRLLRARKDEAEDDSLLIRSAESLGRVIGSLQRQVQDGSKRVSALAGDAMNAVPELPRLDNLFGGTERRARKSSARARTSKNTGGTRKAAGARKAASSRTRQASTSRKRSRSRKSSKKR